MQSNTNIFARQLSRRIAALVLRGILFAALLLPIAVPASPALAATTPVTVTIYFLEQWGDLDLTTLGDFYAEVTINNSEQSTPALDFPPPGGYIVPSGNLLSGPWVVTQDVPSDAITVPVRIEVWESDWPDDDDLADAVPGSDDVIDLQVNTTTGIWTGDLNWPEECIQGSTNFDGRGVKVCFDINTVSTGGDIDGDGLLDNWEQKGVNLDGDSTIDIDLPAFGTSPFRKDILVEVDCLAAADHTHCPLQNAVSDVVNAFARAPVSNLDGTVGVQLHVDTGPLYGSGARFTVPGPAGAAGTYGDFGGGNEIAEAGNEIIESFSSPKGNGVPFDTLKQASFADVRDPIFHYAIFGHQTNLRSATDDCTSGEVSDIPGHDFMVTLGGSPIGVPTFPCWGANANGLSVGSRNQQAGTFMHELGHSVGLKHGGDAGLPNNKPNYLSVMNYAFQMCSLQPSPNGQLPGGCDYSRIELLAPGVPMNEDSLDECIGIGGNLGFGPVNWDQDALLEGITNCQPPNNANVQADINADGIRTLLRGFEDWNSLDYVTGLSGAGAGNGVPDEADPQTIEQAQDILGDQMAPGIVVTKTGPATALPGDTLNYTVEVTNEGFGPALDALLTDINPDGASQEVALGAIVVGDTKTHNSSFTVPSDSCPGDFTGASASVAFKDIVGREFTASGSAPLEILDIVAPTLTVTVSPTTLWPPNHKFYPVTATISVTDNCDADPAVVLVSITSNEPATGFLGNGDRGPDIMDATFGSDDRAFSLRSERGTGGQNTGRVYTILYRATDQSGNVSEVTATVRVPTSNSGTP